MSRVSLVDCLRPLCLNPRVWSACACETRTLVDCGNLLVLVGSVTTVTLGVPTTSPSSHPIRSSRVSTFPQELFPVSESRPDVGRYPLSALYLRPAE